MHRIKAWLTQLHSTITVIIKVSFVIHNLPVIAKMAAVAKAKGNMFQLTQVNS